MTAGVVSFDYTAWSLLYPELASSVSAPVAQQYFNLAQLYCDNTACSPVRDALPGGQREMFLGMLTAHIAALRIRSNAAADHGTIVGRINSAGEGSVNIGNDLEGVIHGRAWFAQTQYGLSAWQAMAQYRTGHYVASPGRNEDPWAAMMGRPI